MSSLKKTIYIPIEIKAREFNSKILFALRAADRGYRVYLGTKQGLHDLFRARGGKSGIYFYKSGNLRDRIRIVRDYCEKLIVLDEEMGVAAREVDKYYLPRTENHGEIDQYYVISEKHRRVLRGLRPEMEGRIFVTGWPRVDLWRREFDRIHADEIARINGEYGRFFLFSSDFSFVSERSIDSALERLVLREDRPDVLKADEALFRRLHAECRAFIRVLHEIDADPGFPPIVVRPHPAEDHEAWFEALRGLKKVKVAFRGEITPWLLAAEGLIHRGCTTAVQAWFSGKPTFFWLPPGGEAPRKDLLPYRLSTVVSDLDALGGGLQAVMAGNYRPAPPDDDISDEIYVPERLACDLILDRVDGLAVAAEPLVDVGLPAALRSSARDLWVRVMDGIGFLRDEYKSKKRGRKLGGGIGAEEVRQIAGHFCGDGAVTVARVVNNVVVVEKRS